MIPPVVSIVAKSGTGKTTLLEKLIPELKSRGYRVGAIKHDAHHFEIDHAGKDSWRLTRAGADTMLISSAEKVAMVKKNPVDEPSVDELVSAYCTDVDIVLTEGFRRTRLPKIEVHRSWHNRQLPWRGEQLDPVVLAIASDVPLEMDVPVYHLDNAPGLVDLLVERFLQ